jgi:hypothetical protein
VRRAVTSLLAALPFEPRSRRAIDETLLDWAHEADGAETPGRRFVVHARSGAGLLRALVVSSALETLRLPLHWFASRVVVLLALPSVVLVLASYGFSPSAAREASATYRHALLLLVPDAAAWLAPMAFFYFAVWAPRQRCPPVIGVALAASVCTFVVAGWIAPVSNQRFRVQVFNAVAQGHADAGPVLTKGLTELTLFELAGRAFEGSPGALNMVGYRTGKAAAAGIFVLFGAAVMQRARRQWWLWLVPPAVVVAELQLRSALQAMASLRVEGLTVWVLAVAALIIALWLPPTAVASRRAADYRP